MIVNIGRGAGFGGLVRYALDSEKEGQKDARVIGGNMSGRDPQSLTAEFGAVRALRDDIKKPVWHASLSLPPGEQLSDERFAELADEFVREMGLDPEKHQYMVVRHNDTEHEHVHIIVNRVALDGSVWHGKQDVKKTLAVKSELEKKYGLEQVPVNRPDVAGLKRGEAGMAERTGDSPKMRLQAAIVDAQAGAKDFGDFHDRLKAQGVNLLPAGKSGSVNGCSFEFEGVAYKGSDLGKAFGWKSLSQSVGYDAERDADLIQQLRSGGEVRKSELSELRNVEELRDAVLRDVYGTRSSVGADAITDTLSEIPDEELRARVDAAVRDELVVVGSDKHGDRYSTRAIVERESAMVAGAKRLAADTRHDLTPDEIRAAIAQKEAVASAKAGKPVHMTDEQREAVEHGLRGGLSIVQGSAGAGKSFSAETIKIGYENRGYSVIGAAVAKRAAQNLQEETGIKSGTVAKLVQDLNKGKVTLNEKTVIVIDEAGQLSTGQWSALVDHCERSGAKLMATGEDKQLDAIQHGGTLRYLSRDDVVGTARIENIVRQREDWARDAVMDLRDGRAESAIKAMDERDLVQFVDGGRKETQAALVKAWHDYEQANPDKKSLVVAHRNEDVRAIGDQIREIRREEGKVTGPDHTLQCAHGDNKFEVKLADGDRVRLNQNDSERDLINGDTGTLRSIRELDGGDYEMTVELDRGGERTFRASEYVNDDGRTMMSSAYAMTVYSSQGVSIDGDVFVQQSKSMDRANTYVAASRAKDNTHLFVDRKELADVDALIKSASRDRVTELAREEAERNGIDIRAANQSSSRRSSGEPGRDRAQERDRATDRSTAADLDADRRAGERRPAHRPAVSNQPAKASERSSERDSERDHAAGSVGQPAVVERDDRFDRHGVGAEREQDRARAKQADAERVDQRTQASAQSPARPRLKPDYENRRTVSSSGSDRERRSESQQEPVARTLDGVDRGRVDSRDVDAVAREAADRSAAHRADRDRADAERRAAADAERAREAEAERVAQVSKELDKSYAFQRSEAQRQQHRHHGGVVTEQEMKKFDTDYAARELKAGRSEVDVSSAIGRNSPVVQNKPEPERAAYAATATDSGVQKAASDEQKAAAARERYGEGNRYSAELERQSQEREQQKEQSRDVPRFR